MDYNDMIQDLIEGTNFEVNSESQVLTSSVLRVRTPIEVINCILGGGIPLNGIYHTWGPPKGGKSTWLYQTMGYFQKDYPDGISVILDNESSSDPNRLLALGVDPTKVLRLPISSIEGGFISLEKMIDNKLGNKKLKDLPMFVIWDTISRGKAQDDSSQSRMNAQDRARIIKNYLPELSAKIENQPFILGLVNQVVYETDRYGNRHENAGGGVALQHDNHVSLYINATSESKDETGSLTVAQWSQANIDKSKISPRISNIPFMIDVTKGGYIVERQSFLSYMIDVMHRISDVGRGFFSLDPLISIYDGTPINEYLVPLSKKWRYKDLVELVNEDDTFYAILRYDFMKYMSSIYSLQANIIKPYFDKVKEEVMSVVNPADESIDELSENANEDNQKEVSENESESE